MEEIDPLFDPPELAEGLGGDSWENALEALASELDEPESANPLGDLIASIDADIAAGAPEAPAKLTPQPEVMRRGHLVFSLSGERFAAPVERVVRLDRLGPLTPVPHTPPWILGVANVRGSIVPALDLRPLLGLSEEAGQVHAGLVQLRSRKDGLVAGVVVDALHGIRTFDDGETDDQRPQELDIDGLFESAPIRALIHAGGPQSG